MFATCVLCELEFITGDILRILSSLHCTWLQLMDPDLGPLPHLSFHSLPGGACASLVGSSVTLQGVWLPPLFHYSLLRCVAATLIALLIIVRVCRCHPFFLALCGVCCYHPHFMLGCTQQPGVPSTAIYCVLFGVTAYVKRQSC